MSEKHIFEVTTKLVSPYLKKHSEFFTLLLENWEYVTPPNWHNKVFPQKLQWLNNDKAILYVKTLNKNSIISLAFDSPTIINQINSFFAKNLITKIIYK